MNRKNQRRALRKTQAQTSLFRENHLKSLATALMTPDACQRCELQDMRSRSYERVVKGQDPMSVGENSAFLLGWVTYLTAQEYRRGAFGGVLIRKVLLERSNSRRRPNVEIYLAQQRARRNEKSDEAGLNVGQFEEADPPTVCPIPHTPHQAVSRTIQAV